MQKEQNREWLCRNCNSLVDGNLNTCPHCRADRPEQATTNERYDEIPDVIERDNYTNATSIAKPKYIFREAVLVNAADISLILGLFCTFGMLIAPVFSDFGIENTTMWAICIAIVIFAITMVTWAVLRTLADISRRLRLQDEERNTRD